MKNWKQWKTQLSSNELASQSFLKFMVYAIVIAVVGYADIAFIQIMSRHFLGGLFGILSMIGAIATAASIIALLFGKAIWFRPGKQLKFAYIFTAAEVLVSLLNVLLSFELTSNAPLDPLMAFWYQFTAATPFVALIGWILILHFDLSQQERHEQLEFEEKTAQLERQQKREQHMAQLEHEQALFESKMALANTYLEYETAYMQQFASSPDVQQRLQAGALKVAMETFSQLTGLPFVAGLPSPTQQPVQPQTNVPTRIGHPMQPKLDRANRQVILPNGSRMSFEDFYGEELAEEIEPSSPLAQSPLDVSNQMGNSPNGRNH